MNALGEAPLFNFAIVPCTELARIPDGINRIWRREIDGMIIQGVLSDETRAGVLERLERRTPPLRRRIIEHVENGTPPPHVLSGGLITSPPDLVSYFEDSAHFRAKCRELFQGYQDFESRLSEVLHQLSAGLPLSVPSGPQGQTYSPATVRVLPSGREIALHSGNDFLHRPECTHMRTLVDNETQLSYFIPLQLPPTGGQLELYSVLWNETDGNRRIDGVPVDFMVALSKKMTAPVGPGDLLIFDGGRIYHRVTPVGAGAQRVTIGGFIGYAKDRRSLYFWS